MKSILKKWAEHFPVLVHLYRLVREELRFINKKVTKTPFGFMLAGDKTTENGTFEPEETIVISEVLKDADTFIDIGANIGFFTCLARSKGKKVIAFEPHPSNVKALFRNLKANQWDDVEVWPIGLSNVAGSMTLWGGGTGASFVEGWAGVSKAWYQTVAVNTVDNILNERLSGVKTLVKVDVEGAEYDLLKGAGSLINMYPRPTWIIEIVLDTHRSEPNPNFAKTFDLFWDNGYEVRAIGKGDTPITKEQVLSWQQKGKCDIDCYNWIFS